jgi:hypothetical protein
MGYGGTRDAHLPLCHLVPKWNSILSRLHRLFLGTARTYIFDGEERKKVEKGELKEGDNFIFRGGAGGGSNDR